MNNEISNEVGPREVDNQFFSALVQSDDAGLDRILSDDFILVDVMRGEEVDKAALIEVVRSGALQFESIEPSDFRVRRYPGTAIITGRTQMYGRFGDAPFAVHSRYTHVYVQLQSQWRLASAQGTAIQPG
jgi:ketosteroid isomerase-like protein